MTAGSPYDAETIESKWQRFWADRGTFRAEPYRDDKFYCYNPAPYVTGALHMGHVRNYTYGDFLSRFHRLNGANVLYTIGFDAFGVPTEDAAMRHRVDPATWTARCIEAMKGQLDRMGFGFDWRRSFSTADPDYYRWTQWIFVEMFREGLIYEREAETLWCPDCEMALARSQTEDDRCFLCSGPVETRVTPQWFLRISRHLDRLRSDLVEVKDGNGQARAGQESLLACRSVRGVRLTAPDGRTEILACIESLEAWSKPLALAVHPEDWPTRRKLDLADPGGPRDVRSVTESRSGRTFDVRLDPTLDEIYVDQPRLIAIDHRIDAREPVDLPTDLLVTFTLEKQKDFSISRQRLWGTPIPMVLCPSCGPTPVTAQDLPVLLPRIEATESGRLRSADVHPRPATCPSCGGAAPMDPQVMDCHFDALWHYIRPCVTSTEESPFEAGELRYWMPVDQIQFGRDTIPFLLTLRLFTKFLQDRGLLDCSEFARETLAHGLILRENRKMSKHLGNVVDPEEVIRRFGADSLRFYVLARSEPRSDYSWSDASLARYHDLLENYFEDLDPRAAGTSDPPAAGPVAGSSARYAAIFLSKFLREVEILESSVASGRFDVYARAVSRILEALHTFRTKQYAQSDGWARGAWSTCATQSIVYLAPIAPHLAEECSERLGNAGSLFDRANWPLDGLSVVRNLVEESRQRRGA